MKELMYWIFSDFKVWLGITVWLLILSGIVHNIINRTLRKK